jgi:hypothetical protein
MTTTSFATASNRRERISHQGSHMYSFLKSKRPGTRRTALSSCLAAAFSLVAIDASATTWTVNTCADNESGNVATHSGSLRFTVGNAGDSDTIDLTGLTCSTISLITGEIAINQNSLTLNGPGASKLTIEKQARTAVPFRVFDHQGSGILKINYLTIARGFEANNSGNAYGGCIYSKGEVDLKQSVVTACEADAPGHIAYGGGVFTKKNLGLKYSTISQSYASGKAARGGGASVMGAFTSTSSTIQNNNAYSANGDAALGYSAVGGGIFATGGVILQSSTISGNSASTDGKSVAFVGGIDIVNIPSTQSAIFISSTISHNKALGNVGYIGGVYSNIPLTLEGSTVAYNYASRTEIPGTNPIFLAPGVAVTTSASSTITLDSSIISGNTYGSPSFELDLTSQALQSGAQITVTGANNLIPTYLGAQIPSDTISACPRLGPLRNNGGPTETHALFSHSPAIDAGNNTESQDSDQRGSPYLRVSGSAADIGAYEVQQDDIIFNDSFGFEEC